MAFQPLTEEQFNKATQAGFKPDQIIQMEKQRKASEGKGEQKGFLKSLIADITSPVVRTGVSLYNMAAGINEGIKTFNKEGIKGDYSKANQLTTQSRNLPIVGETKPILNLKEGAGEGLKAGLTYATFGESTATKSLAEAGLKRLSVGALENSPRLLPTAERVLTAGRGVIPRAVDQAVIGSGFAGAQKLSENKNPTKGDLIGGAVLGGAMPLLGTGASMLKEKVAASSPALASRLINSIVKPLLKDLSYGKDPGRGVAQEGITFRTLEEGAVKIRDAWQNIGKKIGARIEKIEPTPIDFSKAMAPIDTAMAEAQKLPRTNSALIERLNNLKKDLLNVKTNAAGEEVIGTDLSKMTPQQIFEFKQKAADVTKFTGNASDDNVVNKALKQIYGEAKGTLNKLDSGLIKLNERYADLRSAETAILYRDKIIQRHNMVTLTPKMLTGGGLVASAFTMNPTPFLISLGLAGAEKMMSTPIFKSTVAKWLASSSAQEKERVFIQNPALRGFMTRMFGDATKAAPKIKAPVSR